MTNLYLYKIGFYRLYGYPERYIFNFLGRKIGVLFIKESFLSYFYMFTDCSIYPIINFNSKFVYLCNKRSEEHTSELQSRENLVCRLLLEKKNTQRNFLMSCRL